MDVQRMIDHMNDGHKENLIDVCKKFGGLSEVYDVRLDGIDFEGLDLVYNAGKKLRVEFPKKADENSLKDAIIALCMSAKPGHDYAAIAKEIEDYKSSFGSLCLATLSPKGEVVCSYAPYIHTTTGDYIYISEVSEHYANIKMHPNNIEVMFLEDESKAASVILRKRLRYRAQATFIERGALFDSVYDVFEAQTGGAGGIKTIRSMLDFHLVKLEFGKGRFVKGFGQAFDIQGDQISFAGSSGNPHKSPHKAH